MRHAVVCLALSVLLVPSIATAQRTAATDTAPHVVRMIGIGQNVQLEVLDWGGSGRAIVLLAGLGDTGHIFDQFAPRLINDFHVYAVTRRGFGASTADTSGFLADRLGDDVLAVFDSLRLDRPILVGHSIAGQELSSIGSRHPEKVAGLVYLDGAYAYAYYDVSRGDLGVDLAELQRKLTRFWGATAGSPAEQRQLIRELLETDLPAFERALRERHAALANTPERPGATASPQFIQIAQTVLAGQQRYTHIPAPTLAIYALPRQRPPAVAANPMLRSAADALDSTTALQASAFARGVPSARVVRLPSASHYVYMSNEADVLREILAFASGLPGGMR